MFNHLDERNKTGSKLRIGSVVPSTFTEWTHCPECGCKEYINKNELGEGFRMCKDCGQEWWTDIDYNN